MTRYASILLLIAATLLFASCDRSHVTAHITVGEVQGDNAPAADVVVTDLNLTVHDGPQGLVTISVPVTLRLKSSLPTGRPSATPTLILTDDSGTPLCFAPLDDECLPNLIDFLNGPIGAQQQFTFTAVMRHDDFARLGTAVALRLTGFSFTTSPDRALAEPDRV